MSINVNRNITDVFYRYKMPRLIAKVEGKGNGIKTVIVNMSDIAKSLARPPTYPTKYFGCELGAQTQFDSSNDRYIVNGSHDSNKLQELLDGFIKKFVLCPECDNPETNLIVYQKKQTILQNCIACGHQSTVDMRHKLTTFILKNPPEQENSTSEAVAKRDKKDKTDKVTSTTKSGGKKSNTKAGKDNTSDNGNGDVVHNSDADSTPVNGKKLKRSTKNHHNDDSNDDDQDWSEDTSDAAVQARKDGLSNAARNMTLSDDLEKTLEERINMFHSFVKQKKDAGSLIGGEKEKEILLEADRLEIKDRATLILAEVLFDAGIIQQIKMYKSLLRKFTNDNEKAQQYLLGGFELLVGTEHYQVLMPKVAHILKVLYEEDILDEEIIIEWSKKPSKKYLSKELSKEVHAKAEPFIKWLQEAEEESSDEEDEDLEVVYLDRVQVATTRLASADKLSSTPGQKNSFAESKNDNDIEDDDLNIDNI